MTYKRRRQGEQTKFAPPCMVHSAIHILAWLLADEPRKNVEQIRICVRVILLSMRDEKIKTSDFNYIESQSFNLFTKIQAHEVKEILADAHTFLEVLVAPPEAL